MLLTCEICSVAFERGHNQRLRGGAWPRTCSHRHGNLLRFIGASSALPWRECSECGAEFYARIARLTCSEICERSRERSAARASSTAASQPVQRVCRGCSGPFTTGYGDKRRSWCSRDCQHRAEAPARLAALHAKRRRRSRRRPRVIAA